MSKYLSFYSAGVVSAHVLLSWRLAVQQQVPTKARMAKRAPRTVMAYFDQEKFSQTKTINKTAIPNLHQQLDMSVSFRLYFGY